MIKVMAPFIEAERLVAIMASLSVSSMFNLESVELAVSDYANKLLTRAMRSYMRIEVSCKISILAI